MKKETIEPWSVFGAHVVSIEAHKLAKGEYQGALTFILDDGEKLSENVEDHKGISILLDCVLPSAEKVIQHLAPMVGQMFERISITCIEFDTEGELHKKHDLEKIMKKAQKQNKSNVVFAN